MAPRKETAKPPHAQAALENRKLRNRLSQKAFRDRQNLRLKELEKRLANGSVDENQRVAELEERNRVLYGHLQSCHKKLQSMQVTLQSFTDSTAALLGLSVPSNSSGTEESAASNPSCDQQTKTNNARLSDTAIATDRESSIGVPNQPSNLLQHDEVSHSLDTSIGSTAIDEHLAASDLSNIAETSYDKAEIPTDQANEAMDIFSSAQTALEYPGQFDQNFLHTIDRSHRPFSPVHNTDHHLTCFTTTLSFSTLGPSSYDFAAMRGPLLVKGTHSEVRRTNSAFSDHFNVVEHFLQESWKNSDAVLTNLDDCLRKAIPFMLSMFVCSCWPKMAAWQTWTVGNFGAWNVMAWRLNPTLISYMNLPQNYRPTQTQLSMPHPTVIDWIIWPELRDKLILCHSANPYLDDIIREIGNSYVVEAELSTLVAGLGPQIGYVSVWDIVRAISPDATLETAELYQMNGFPVETFFEDDSATRSPIEASLPAPSASALFDSRYLAAQAFKLLNMEKVENVRLDPTFFENHPELSSCRGSLAARGVPLKSPSWRSMPSPKPIESTVVRIYRELTDQALHNSFSEAFQTAMISVA